MPKVIAAELRDSWPAWLGVSLGFVMTGFSLALAALIVQSALSARELIPAMEAEAYTIIGGSNLVLSTVVGLSVVGSATALVVESRRGALARLALAGATPAGVVGSMLSQLAGVALAAAVMGDLLAALALRPTLDYLQLERGAEGAGIPVPGVIELPTLLTVNLLWVLVVLVGGYRQARRASRIAPVEALRQSQSGQQGRRRDVGRWVRAGLAFTIVVGMFVSVPAMTASRTSETFTQIMQLNLFGLVVIGWLFAELMPTIVRPLTAWWTAPVPGGSTWWIARATVLARSVRLARSVTPVMFTVGLAFGVIGLPATFNAIFAANGVDVQLEHVGAETFLVNLGLPLAIAMCGSVGSLVMMSRQRSAELALLGIAGATVGQRSTAAALEALIMTGTAAILGFTMVATCLAHLAYATPSAGLGFALDIPFGPFLIALLVTGGVTVATTLLPTVSSQKLPEPRVIARLVAD